MELKRKVFEAINESQEGKPLTQYFSPVSLEKSDAAYGLEFDSNGVGDSLNLLLVRLIDDVQSPADVEELKENLDYALDQLRRARLAVDRLDEQPDESEETPLEAREVSTDSPVPEDPFDRELILISKFASQ